MSEPFQKLVVLGEIEFLDETPHVMDEVRRMRLMRLDVIEFCLDSTHIADVAQLFQNPEALFRRQAGLLEYRPARRSQALCRRRCRGVVRAPDEFQCQLKLVLQFQFLVLTSRFQEL